jgi:hypothetical protein
MKRTLKFLATLSFLAVCIGLVPAEAAGKMRPRLPAPDDPDVFDLAWSQIVTQAQRFFPVLRIVHVAPDNLDLEQATRQVLDRELSRRPVLVVPDYDRDFVLQSR